MNNQQTGELIATLQTAIALANSLSDTISNREEAEEINKLSIRLREAVQAKMPTTHTSILEIN